LIQTFFQSPISVNFKLIFESPIGDYTPALAGVVSQGVLACKHAAETLFAHAEPQLNQS